MQETRKSTESIWAVGGGLESENAVTEQPPATGRLGRSRISDELPQEGPTPVEGETATVMEASQAAQPASSEASIMGGLTIRELEMTPRMEELSKLTDIQVSGSTRIAPEVIAAIAGATTQAVQGVAALGTPSLRRTISDRIGISESRARGIQVEAGSREVILDINVRTIYGYNIPRIAAQIRQNVAERMMTLCGLIAKEVNIRVIGLEFSERAPRRVQ